MTATDVSTVTPANSAAESTSKETSPVKSKTPEQIKEEAAALIATGKRDLLLNNIPEAVSSLAQACELLSKQFGETAKECAEVYFYYGKALLDLSRMESGVLGNALDGVPEEESESNTSQFEDPAKLSDKEKDEVTDNVTEALEENFKDLEEKKKSADTKKEGTEEEKKAEASKDESSKDDQVKAKDTDEKSSKDETKQETEGDKSKTTEGEEDEAMEEDEESEDGGEESSDEKKEDGTEEKKDEEEEPSNLQLAWEMLELAKVVYSKQLETGEGDKLKTEEKLCSTICALGEVSIENENYKQAVEDFQDCLKKQCCNLPSDARFVFVLNSLSTCNASLFRCIAETNYQLGVAQGYHAQFDEAVESLQKAISIIKERIKNKEKDESEEAKKEVKELEALIPEIEEKINDTKDMKKEAENKKSEGVSSGGDAFKSGSEKVAEVKPVSSIAVKRKAEDEESSSKKLASDKETAAAS